MDKQGLIRLLRTEGFAFVLVMGLATLVAVVAFAFVAVVGRVTTSDGLDVAVRIASLTWIATVAYATPFAATVGVAAFVVIFRGKRRLPAIFVAATLTAAAAWLAYPAVEKCGTSISARQTLSERLAPEARSTLRSPETLSDASGFCSTYFEYRTSSGWIEASAVFDPIRGVEIFEKPVARK